MSNEIINSSKSVIDETSESDFESQFDQTYNAPDDLENLFNKNTKSFQCLTQIEISSSSIFRHPLYFFPELEDPHVKEALWDPDPEVIYDNIGCERYIKLCKDQYIVPFTRVLNSLPTDTLDLKYYSLTTKAVRTICETMRYNECVKYLSLQGNWLKPEAVGYLSAMMEANKTLVKLDLKDCHIGASEAYQLYNGLWALPVKELDLSYNELADQGIEAIAPAIQVNSFIRILNLSHNKLGDGALAALGPLMEENYSITDLDLSWNSCYGPSGMSVFMDGLKENLTLTSLNLSWNAISEKDTMRGILSFLKAETTRLEHLDLSNNRLTGVPLKMLRAAVKENTSLLTLNLSYNPITPEEVMFFCAALLEPKEISPSLTFIDFENIWVKKDYIRMRTRLRKKGITVIIGGIYSNYKIKGPNIKRVILNRAKFVAMSPKKKKKKKDFGIFLVTQKEDTMKKEELLAAIKKSKIKLDEDLKQILLSTFEGEKKRVDIADMKSEYLDMYPDTQAPPKQKKKKKKKKKSKKLKK